MEPLQVQRLRPGVGGKLHQEFHRDLRRHRMQRTKEGLRRRRRCWWTFFPRKENPSGSILLCQGIATCKGCSPRSLTTSRLT